MKKSLTALLFFLLIISCKEGNKLNEQKSKLKIANDIEFQNKFNNSPKLFSKFWSDMDPSDFYRVIDTLKSKGKITQKSDSLIFDLDGYDMLIESEFVNKKLKKIILTSPLQPLGDYSFQNEYSPYNLFKEKYVLQDLKRSYKYYQKSTFPNNDYKLTQYVFLTNGLSEIVPNSLIDNFRKKYEYVKPENDYSYEQIERFALPNKKLIIDKGNNINMIIEEIPSSSKIGKNIDLIYSLEDIQNEIPQEIKIKYRINGSSFLDNVYKSFNDQTNMESIGDYLIRKNSRFVTHCYFQNYDLKITYVTKEHYSNEQKELIKKEIEEKEFDNRIKELNKEENERKKKKALDAI
tara:strand:+ start:1845 stop:2891 length:1047 start_codon:yes stop_codon:yes gene_type:complete